MQRRNFIKASGLVTAGLGLAGNLSEFRNISLNKFVEFQTIFI